MLQINVTIKPSVQYHFSFKLLSQEWQGIASLILFDFPTMIQPYLQNRASSPCRQQ